MKNANYRQFSLGIAILLITLLTAVGYFIVHKSHALTADINSDGKVNATDLSILASNYGKSGQTFAQGDINGDGFVGVVDLSILASNWGTTTAACTGVAMTTGQTDINNNPTNTTFCLSGVHNNWTLSPKTGDKFIGDGTAVLDGTNSTVYAFTANSASNVTLQNLEIRNYKPASQAGAIEGNGTAAPGWVLSNLQVHDNGLVCPTPGTCDGGAYGGYGTVIGSSWQILGGRYYNNRQGGISGTASTGIIINGAEVDHNNFTDDNYTTANIDCGFEAGGTKWVLSGNAQIINNKYHDNACRGIWADIDVTGATVDHNTVYNNWEEGIFIEISEGGSSRNIKVTNNNVYNNGLKAQIKNYNGCPGWMMGGGITISTSSGVEVSGNTVQSACNGITGVEQPRGNVGDSTSNPLRILDYIYVHDNTITGTGSSGFARSGDDPNPSLTNRNIIWQNNTLSGGQVYCGVTC